MNDADFKYAVTAGDDTADIKQCAEYGIWYVACRAQWCPVDMVMLDHDTAADAERFARDHLAEHGVLLAEAFTNVIASIAS